MTRITWQARAAKRIVAEAALRAALAEVEKARATGGPETSSCSNRYKLARHLTYHATEQLRMSEGDGE